LRVVPGEVVDRLERLTRALPERVVRKLHSGTIAALQKGA
jgi:hypothetical protein